MSNGVIITLIICVTLVVLSAIDTMKNKKDKETTKED